MREARRSAERLRTKSPPLAIGLGLVFLVLVVVLSTGRYGSAVTFSDLPEASHVRSGTAQTRRSLVAQSTPVWEALNAEGLFHENSGYPRVVPPDEERAAEARTWEERMAKEWPNGCRQLGDGLKRCLPKLIIIGQFKCGTTALFDTLAQHPDLHLPHSKKPYETKCPRQQQTCVVKEANGFLRLNYGQRWTEELLMHRYDPISPDVPVDDERPLMEASPYYLTGMPDSFEDLTRFQRYVPGVKIIAIVRNPVERAFSEYLMLSERPFRQRALGCSWGHNFSFELLADEELRVRSEALLSDPNMMNVCLQESTKFQRVLSLPNGTSRFQGRLLGWGEYARFAELWMRTLPPSQLTFVKTEDLEGKQGPQVVADLLQWAGLRQVPLKVRRSNTAACRGSHARGAFDPEREKQIESGGCEGPAEQSPQEAMDPAMAARLHEHFRPHNERFAAITGLDVSVWETSKHTRPKG